MAFESDDSLDHLHKYGLRKNPSTVTVMDSSNLGEGVETGSTVARDVHSDATSHNMLSDIAGIDGKSDVIEKSGGSIYNEDSQNSDVIQHYSSGSAASSGRMVSDLRSTTENAYGGGLYGNDGTCASKTTGHASDFQSAEGLASDMPKHKEVHSDSSGDRIVDITGQSYIQ